MGSDDSFHKGLKAYREGNYQEAVQLLKRAVSENEGNHKAWNALGVTLSKMGQIEEAVSCYENALKYDPGNTSYEQNRDQIVRKAFSRIPSVPRPEGLGIISMNYRRFIIPSVLLILLALIAVYVVIILPPSVTGNGGDVTPPLPIPTGTPAGEEETTAPAGDLPPVPAGADEEPPSVAEPREGSDTAVSVSSSLLIPGDLSGKYSSGLTELSFQIAIPDNGEPQYLPRVSYLWSVGSLDPVMVLPANPASGTMKPGETHDVTLLIPVNLQPRAGERFSLEIRPPSGTPAFFSTTLPDTYSGGIIINPMKTRDSSASSGAGSGSSPGSGSSSTMTLDGAVSGFYSHELEELSFTLRSPTTGSPQDLSRISYLWSAGGGEPVKITRVHPSSGTINPGEQQLVTISIPETHRPAGGESFTLEIQPDTGSSLVVKRDLSSAYKGGIIS